MRIVIWNSVGVENLLTKGSTDFIRDLSLIKNCTDIWLGRFYTMQLPRLSSQTVARLPS